MIKFRDYRVGEAIDKKYEFTGKTYRKLKQIRALKNFNDVKAGDIGGWIEKEENLSHEGNCWVSDNAKVSDDAKVYGNAQVSVDAVIKGNAKVYDSAVVHGAAQVYGNAVIKGNAEVYLDAQVSGNAIVDYEETGKIEK